MPGSHDWSHPVDPAHLAEARRSPVGVTHLVLEVLAHADEEAEATGRTGRATVTLHPDGSVEVTDDGRGTDTRADRGTVVRKPVFSTRALEHWASASPELLPDGLPRRGLSVVGALSTWLVHTNRRRPGAGRGGAWTQRYEHGVPVTGLLPVADDGTTGTAVRFLPADGRTTADTAPLDTAPLDTAPLHGFPHVRVTVVRA